MMVQGHNMNIMSYKYEKNCTIVGNAKHIEHYAHTLK